MAVNAYKRVTVIFGPKHSGLLDALVLRLGKTPEEVLLLALEEAAARRKISSVAKVEVKD